MKNNYQLPITNYQLQKGGFSFIELMTVVAIMALLIAVSMPMFRNYTRGKNLKEGTNMIVSALRRTRNTTITERKKYRTVFDTLNHAVAIYKEDDVVNPAENWHSLPEFIEFDTTNFFSVPNFPPAPAIPDPDLYYLEFKPSGGLSTSGNGHITLKETSTEDITEIYFYNVTGRISVE